MKKLTRIALTVASVTFITALIINPVSAKKGGGVGKPIPDGIMKIAQKSCVNCHTEPGNFLALSHLNLGKWDSYSPAKQASKAKAMCDKVTKGKMPPKNFRENHPDGVPSKEEIKTICDWAESIQITKK
ncbi:MAG: heme-binding domain-containing protein [Bacteroidales bacterium]|jgi:hypothetical protein|nr:heme-binding domain-containing protein [Bacteroidales bacterium]